MQDYQPVPLPDWVDRPEEEMRRRAADYYELIRRRHSVRSFSDRPVPRIHDRCNGRRNCRTGSLWNGVPAERR